MACLVTKGGERLSTERDVLIQISVDFSQVWHL
jgi:hypothetical protein